MITTEQAIQMAREYGYGGQQITPEELTAFANAIERNVVNGLCEVEKDNEFLVAAVDSAIKDRDYYIAKLQEAERDAARWIFFVEVIRKDMGESIAKFLPEEPMENFSKAIIDAAIDAAMEGAKLD